MAKSGRKRNRRKRNLSSLTVTAATEQISEPPMKKQRVLQLSNAANKHQTSENAADNSSQHHDVPNILNVPFTQASATLENTETLLPGPPPMINAVHIVAGGHGQFANGNAQQPPNQEGPAETEMHVEHQHQHRDQMDESEHHKLGVLMSGQKPGLFTRRETIIHQLHQMAETGSLPLDLQQQMRQYQERKVQIIQHIKQRAEEHMRLQSQLQLQNECSEPESYICDADTNDLEETNQTMTMDVDHVQHFADEMSQNIGWNKCTSACVLTVALLLLVAMTMVVPVSTHGWRAQIYCDTDVDKNACAAPKLECPQNAICGHGLATCPPSARLHAMAGCLPLEQYARQQHVDEVYGKMWLLLRERRSAYIIDSVDCSHNVSQFQMPQYEIEQHFRDNRGGVSMNDTELERALSELFGKVLMDSDRHADIVHVVVGTESVFYADIQEWKKESVIQCRKLIVWLVAKQYVLPCAVGAVFVFALLIFMARKSEVTIYL